ncbi:MAG: aminodeoxychorismate/anthranilate synthase component II [Bacteroidota bacterium]|nr:aminodeoxychorismate/anthranilate synthase component II [Bacteroidota bacterium]MDP4211918.1 aminodeoxychorismate/anthranilate synthase component II [Bacteroidota bacterium]MDP4249277.1 aminodeoxychorismate/anthranilate synthase component II [Bacteroidota bacterium]
MKILVFDNYDSFTYNLVHLVEKIIGEPVDVFRNDQISMEKVDQYDKIILSPGPGLPSEAGLLLTLIKQYAPSKSILGVCLGHQAIGEAFGGRLLNLSTVYHGVALPVEILHREEADQPQNADLFAGIPDQFPAGRYHSWVIDPVGFPDALEITAKDANGHIMAIRHRKYDVLGVQFHPESVLTPEGETLMRNWLRN